MKDLIKSLAIHGLNASGMSALMRPWYRGRGVIFTFHRVVRPDTPTLHQGITVTTTLLEAALRYVRRLGWEFISMQELVARLRQGDASRPFACCTFDDGFVDNLSLALPIMREYRVPMCVFPCTGFLDRGTEPSTGRPNRAVRSAYVLLEHLLVRHDRLAFPHPAFREPLVTRSFSDKQRAYFSLLSLEARDPAGFNDGLDEVFRRLGLHAVDILDGCFLDWDGMRELASDPLVEIGAHSVTHRPLRRLDETTARWEMEESRAILKAKLGVPVRYFAYPFGSVGDCARREFDTANELGFEAAVTTRRGNIFDEHGQHLLCLPRVAISMVAHSASLAYIKTALYGSRNGLVNRFARVVTD